MRIGIDAHIILPQHKRYNPKIARYTQQLIEQLLEADKKQEHTWVLFFDDRMDDKKLLKRFERPNVEIKHFPFVQYRQFLPVVYSHMLISAFLLSARLDVFHSPEGLVPFMYPGKVVASFFYVPRGVGESGLFSQTFMLGARIAFAQIVRHARRVVVNSAADKKILIERWRFPAERIVLIEEEDIERVDWPRRTRRMLKVYREVGEEKQAPEKAAKAQKRKAAKAKV